MKIENAQGNTSAFQDITRYFQDKTTAFQEDITALWDKLSNISLMFPIVGSHVKRIGFWRTLGGGLSMYLSIPGFVMVHLTSGTIFFQWLIRPLIGTKRLKFKDYVILDRHRIDGIPFFDKFNCLFCGYACGLITLANKEIDQVGQSKEKLNPFKRIALPVVLITLYIPQLIIGEIFIQIVYNLLVSRPLGMHRVSIKEAFTILKENSFAEQHPQPLRTIFRYYKNVVLRIAMLLEQIESSWCPLKHFERREGIVYPEYHKNFFGPEEIERMRHILLTEGTVSDRKPTW